MSSPLPSLGFAGFVLDRETGRLLGRDSEIRLRPQAYRLLEVLAESAPRILSQDELLDRAWGVEHLSPASVKQAVSEVRQALGDDPGRPTIIETVHRRGYRFIAPLVPIAQVRPDLSTRPVKIVPREGPPGLRRLGAVMAALTASVLTLGFARRTAKALAGIK